MARRKRERRISQGGDEDAMADGGVSWLVFCGHWRVTVYVTLHFTAPHLRKPTREHRAGA